MQQARDFGVRLLVFHLGNTGQVDAEEHERVVAATAKRIRKLLKKVPEVDLAVETMTDRCCGETSHSLDAIQRFITLVNMPGRVKFCMDLCHVYMQFDLAETEARGEFLRAVEGLGREAIAAVHLSDSLEKHGTRKDSHTNLDFGYIGSDAFREILRHPSFSRVPIILETPGYFCGNRDRDQGVPAQIGCLERARHELEIQLINRITDATDEEWAADWISIRKNHRKEKAQIETKIRNLVMRTGGTLRDTLLANRAAVNGKLCAVGRHWAREGKGLSGSGRRHKKPRRSSQRAAHLSDPISSIRETRAMTVSSRRRQELRERKEARANAAQRPSFREESWVRGSSLFSDHSPEPDPWTFEGSKARKRNKRPKAGSTGMNWPRRVDIRDSPASASGGCPVELSPVNLGHPSLYDTLNGDRQPSPGPSRLRRELPGEEERLGSDATAIEEHVSECKAQKLRRRKDKGKAKA
ncbi:xylose isomerase-like protein [Kockovaella imperatae]|uniref:Xylose isomerase-like protein n=1 Tax=Kockovaella imperatae TaxID=4999 RepID=A0A1Y1U6A3_9TREE|nr:xylose isomerase-like protein [Kockovaella imperatae]ORX33548.1 xylose isomerase-like protein [Kockovaella imperatae]